MNLAPRGLLLLALAGAFGAVLAAGVVTGAVLSGILLAPTALGALLPLPRPTLAEHVLELSAEQPPPTPVPTIPVPPPQPPPAVVVLPALPSPTASPTQYYLTCQNGQLIVGTSTEGACRAQGGVRSVATVPPSPTSTGAATSDVAFLQVEGAPPGGRARVTIQSQPRQPCSILYLTPAGTPSRAAGLNNTITDERGQASWEWTISPTTPRGTARVTVSCGTTQASTALVIE
ncbi:MAG: hypothetical protein K6U89_16770 [Chloroflexi bacterium]|nr:hypothetical protein [Chloroflexota bacterium]